VPEFCTCGAQLPADARFCHKCGKPQREEPAGEAAPQPAAAEAPPAALVLPAIDFRNPVAVRVAFLAALLANLLNALPYLILGCPLWLLGSGFLCAYLYRRRTGQPLPPRSGARLGWMTGVFSFVIFTVFFTFSFIMAVRSGTLVNRQQLSQIPFLQGNLDQVIELMQSPLGLAVNLAFSLIVLFVLFTLLATAGGALGAKVLGKADSAPSRSRL
jgi:hypothetical protein